MSKYYPKVFSASIGGYMGPSYSVEWKDGQLSYTACRQGYKKLAKSSGVLPDSDMKDWQEFWSEIDRLNVWQ